MKTTAEQVSATKNVPHVTV